MGLENLNLDLTMLKIQSIEKESLAESVGLLPGDKILKMNGEEVRDKLDFEFLRGESEFDLEIMRGASTLHFRLEREYGQPLGIEPEVMKIHLCKNKCVFCFVHQTPKGMRKSLYVKDEDYRYSFLDGHFTTLSNMGEKEWTRVLEQKLSPIYVSVHATNHELRKKLLVNSKIEPIMDRLHWLKKNKIDFHTQIVVCPEWNDGQHLRESLTDLLSLKKGILSISVVPVGLTRYRDHLPHLRSFTKQDAELTLDICDEFEEKSKKIIGKNIVFGSDELYVLTGRPLREPEFYGNFEQYENGVGTLTSFLSDFKKELPQLPQANPQTPVTLLTAPLAYETHVKVMEELQRKKQLVSEVIVCTNHTFGDSVTCSGLLGGKDLFRGCMEQSKFKGKVLIPPNSLNSDQVFIDDWTPSMLEAELGRPVIVPQDFASYFK